MRCWLSSQQRLADARGNNKQGEIGAEKLDKGLKGDHKEVRQRKSVAANWRCLSFVVCLLLVK